MSANGSYHTGHHTSTLSARDLQATHACIVRTLVILPSLGINRYT